MAGSLEGDRIGVPNGTSNPAGGAAGDFYYNSTNKEFRVYNGTEWSNGGVVYGELGSQNNPAASIAALQTAGKSSGVYYLQDGSGGSFQTYVLINGPQSTSWGLAYIVHNPTDGGDFGYNASYWSSLGEKNVTTANLDPAGSGSASLNVATKMVETYSASKILVSYRYRDGNYNNYIYGTATNATAQVTTTRTSNGTGFTMTITGTDYNNMVWNTGSSATTRPGGPGRHNEWIVNASQTGYVQSGGASYARLGQANVAEPYAGAFYSSNARGVGLRSRNNCSGNDRQEAGGKTNARHSAGGCGDGPSNTHDTSQKFEVWLA